MRTLLIKHIQKISDVRTFIFYACVGAFAAFVYFSVFTVCWKVLKLDVKVSISIGYALSVITHFTANRRLTFRSHKEKIRGQMMRYAIMTSVNYMVTLVVAHVVIGILHLSPYLSICASISVTVFIGYMLARNWVFKLREDVSL